MTKQIEEDSSNLLTLPMDEQKPLQSLLHLLSPKEQGELWAIKHMYSFWKDFVGQDNEHIVEWNLRHRRNKTKKSKEEK